MAAEREDEEMETEGGAGNAGMSGLGRPLLLAATFAAGVGAALGTKALLDSRRNGRSGDDDGSGEDLPSVLRRAGLDVAIAAANQAAETLGRDHSEPQNDETALQRS